MSNFSIIIKKMISFYIKSINIEMSSKNFTAQEYFEKHGINEYALMKTCAYHAYTADYLKFILTRAFEFGYFINQNDDILQQIDRELENISFPRSYDSPITESSADLD